jgi:uncharacterized protein with GYD domain
MYIMFGKYSLDSIKEISAKRTEKAVALIEKHGGTYKAGYALLGEHDVMVVAEFPGTEQAMAASVGLTKLLGISFTTSPAVSIEAFDQLTL